jgi:methyltransferase (TIGR04290 family)
MTGAVSQQDIQQRVRELGEWFQNMDLCGVQTAPHHFLGDYPRCKWQNFAQAVPADLRGKSVLDIGCNAGFYSLEMKRRGAAHVVGVDSDESYLAQARFAAQVLGFDVEYRELDVYDVAKLGRRFDLVLFMGVLYHLRHPLLALDLLWEHVVGETLVLQTLIRGGHDVDELAPDYPFWETRIFEDPSYPAATSWSTSIRTTPGSKSWTTPKTKFTSARGGITVVEAVMLWNEPNNLSHWNFEIDPGWAKYAAMVKLASDAVRAEYSDVRRVLGGISPIDPDFICNMRRHGVMDHVDVVAVHGFPLDWNHWSIHEWPDRIREIENVTDLPLWVSEAGTSSFGAEEVQQFGLKRAAELLIGRVERIHWYSLYDLPRTWPATTRHREAEGSSYYRHFYMGLLREDGTPKLALRDFSNYTPELGICQWFHFEDHRLDDAVRWLRDLGVQQIRTGLSWADSFRPNAEQWFDRQMKAMEPFQTTITYCFTPEHCGELPSHTSPPRDPRECADFCARMTRRYT